MRYQEWSLSNSADMEVREAWAEWLASAVGAAPTFGTWTIRPPEARPGSTWSAPGASFVGRKAATLVQVLTSDGGTAFAAVEGDRRKRYHVHTLSSSFAAAEAAESWWRKDLGYVGLRTVKGGEDGARAVRLYVAKYVTKGDGQWFTAGAGWRKVHGLLDDRR